MKILILDDNHFYSKLVQRQIRHHLNQVNNSNKAEVKSHTDVISFLDDLDENVGGVIIDFYLGNGITGMHALHQVRKRNRSCAIAIMSAIKGQVPTKQLISSGAQTFIPKDDHYGLVKACYFAQNALEQFSKA